MADNIKPLTEYQNLFFAFESVADRYPNQTAFKADGGWGQSYSYNDVKGLIIEIANGLNSKSFKDCQEIGLLAENRPEWGIAYLGIIASGKTVVPIDVNLKETEINYLINHANIKVIFTVDKFIPLITKKRKIEIFTFDDNSKTSWRNLLSTNNQPLGSAFNKVAALIYTSGTTGNPKAVELTHNNILSNLEQIHSSLTFTQNDIFLSLLPLHHTLETTCGLLTPLMSGATIIYARSLKSKNILEDIKNNKVTIMLGVPLLFEKMYNSIKKGVANVSWGKRSIFNFMFFITGLGWNFKFKWGKLLFKKLREKVGLGSLRMFVSGGAPLPPYISCFFNYLGFDFLQGYGMTECSPVISVNQPENIKFGSVGPLLNNVEIKINNPDENGVGEILVKGGNVTFGYRDNPEETKKLFQDGWLCTGDLGYFDKGHLWITGRKKNLIISAAGKNIYPEQIEEKLMESDYILEAIVLSRKKENKQGEEVYAIIVPNMELMERDSNITIKTPDMKKIRKIMEEEIAQINNQMAAFKRISNFDIQLNELEKTSTKKVKRFLYR